MYDSRDELFVPPMADTSDFTFQQPISLQSTDENYWRRKMIASSNEINQNTADITLESLLDAPISSRNLVSSALDTNRDGLLNGLQAMKARINTLETRQTETKRNFVDLQKATDTYTKLLQQKPVEKKFIPCEDDVESGNLLDDKNIQSIYDRLQLRLRHLETQKRLTNSSTDQEFHTSNGVLHQFSNGSLSDVEKMRGGNVSDAKMIRELYNLDTVPVLDGGSEGKTRLEVKQKVEQLKFKTNVASDVASSGSSRSLKLTENQRQKLDSFSEKLRTSQILPAAASSPIVQRFSLANKSIQCEVCHLDKSTQCICYSNNNVNRTEKWAQTSFMPKENSVQTREIEPKSRLDYDQLRRQLLQLKNKAREQNLLQPEKLSKDVFKRASSAPASPVRKLQRAELFYEDKKPAFVAGKSTESSHSIDVNLQELLAILKRQNPALHQICLKMGNEVSLVNMADAFDKELTHLKRKASTNLVEKIKSFEQLSKEIQTCKDSSRKNDLERKQNALVSEIEQADTYIQRLDAQCVTLDGLTKKARALMSMRNKRGCGSFRPRVASDCSPSAFTDCLTKHTVSSRQKASAFKKPAKHANHQHSVQILKDIKLAKDVLNVK